MKVLTNPLPHNIPQAIEKHYDQLHGDLGWAWKLRHQGITDPIAQCQASAEFYLGIDSPNLMILKCLYGCSQLGTRSLLSVALDALRLSWTRFNQKHRVVQ